MNKILNFVYVLIKKNLKLEKKLRKWINNILDIYESIFYPYPNRCFEIKKQPPKKILLIAYGGTGDIAIYSSFTQFLRQKYKKAKIEVIIPNNKKIVYIASLDKNINKIIPTNFPRFFTFNFYNKLKKNIDYDMSIILSPYPNLRYLMPYFSLINFPFFIYKYNFLDRIPVPKLTLDFKQKKQNYIFINLEMLTFDFVDEWFNQQQIEDLIFYLSGKFPNEKFIINKFINYSYENFKKIKNLEIFEGDYKKLLKISSQAKAAILSRSGLADVLAASTKNLPMFIIYPDVLYPGKNGVPFINIWGMKDIGYKNPIKEIIFNQKNTKMIKQLKLELLKFIKAYSKGYEQN